MDFEAWAAFVAASAVLLVVPGPNVLLVVACTLGQGRRAALPLAWGMVLGDATLMTLSLLGVGGLVLASPALFAAAQWAGAAYLAWLGAGLWREGARGASRAAADGGAGGGLVLRAWLSVVLNPLTLAFFVAFLPQFVDPGRRFWMQALVLEATFLALTFANVLGYAWLARRLGEAGAGPGRARALSRASGLALLGVGLWMAAGGA